MAALPWHTIDRGTCRAVLARRTSSARHAARRLALTVGVVLSVIASDEMLRLVGSTDEKPVAFIVSLGNLAIVASSGVVDFWPGRAAPPTPIERLAWPAAAVAIAVLVAFVGEMARYERPGRVVVRVALAALSFVYVGLFLSFVVQLRLFGSNLTGMTALVSLIAVVKMGDSGAYTIGRLFGRHKMTPTLSPGKTWEGEIGAVMGAVLGAWLAYRLMPSDAERRRAGFPLGLDRLWSDCRHRGNAR